jgi:hypothetical protein
MKKLAIVSTLALAALAGLAGRPALATDDAMLQIQICRAGSPNPTARLACYDRIAATPAATTRAAPPSTAPIAMELADLKVDIASLAGKTIATKGRFMMMGQLGFLYDGVGDTTPVQVSIGSLDRDTQKRLMACGFEGCEIELTGRVGHNVAGYGVQALSAR